MGNENCFELAGGLSFRWFKLPGVDCSSKLIACTMTSDLNTQTTLHSALIPKFVFHFESIIQGQKY